jgi:hypothetical protein
MIDIKKVFDNISRMPTTIEWAESFYSEVCEIKFGFEEEIV